MRGGDGGDGEIAELVDKEGGGLLRGSHHHNRHTTGEFHPLESGENSLLLPTGRLDGDHDVAWPSFQEKGDERKTLGSIDSNNGVVCTSRQQ